MTQIFEDAQITAKDIDETGYGSPSL